MGQPLQSLSMSFSGIVAADGSHPNRMSFRGVLVRLDEPSDKAPNGSDGHRIMVPSAIAKDKLNTLIGMGLNYKPRKLDGHAQQNKVGVITSAWIDGRDLWVKGHVWKHDFPEAEDDLKQRGLGMSMEIGDVRVDDPDSKVWELTDFCFLGATILWKDSAAYHKTQAIAASIGRSVEMTKTVKPGPKKALPVDQDLVASIAASVGQTIAKNLSGFMSRQTEALTSIAGILQGMQGGAKTEEEVELTAEAATEDIETKKKEAEACDMKSAKADKELEDDEPDGDEAEEDDEEMESAIDKGELEEMGPDTDGDFEPGTFNEGVKNKGAKTASENKTGKNVSQPVSGSAVKFLYDEVKTMKKQLDASRAENAKLRKKLEKVDAQITAATAQTTRRSLAPEIVGLLAKSGLDAEQMHRTQQKLSPAEVDAVLQASGVQLDVTKRMETKNRLIEAGLMDEGRVDRGVQIGR